MTFCKPTWSYHLHKNNNEMTACHVNTLKSFEGSNAALGDTLL